MNRNWRDLIGGIFLVPALHLGFLLLLLWIQSITGSYPLGLLVIMSFYYIGITQFVYLIPVMVFFGWRRRFEVLKGMAIGAILTILVNGACFLIVQPLIN
jgi:hypothetical protein